MVATILLVDADSANRADWQAILQNQGYKVFSATTGKIALEECPRLQPDLVLLQVSLPDINGFEVCRRIKANPLNRLTPAVLMPQALVKVDPGGSIFVNLPPLNK